LERQRKLLDASPDKPQSVVEEKPCPFCGKNGPTSAIRCKYCGKFKKKAKLTVENIRDEHAKEATISAIKSIRPGDTHDWENMLNNLPRVFLIDYSSALKLEILLRNKGVQIRIEDGVDIKPLEKNLDDSGGKLNAPPEIEPPKIEQPTHSETVYSKISVEQVLKDIYLNSSIWEEFVAKFFKQRKDLLMIVLIAFIPLLSTGLPGYYQLLFYPIYIGMLWTLTVFSFFGDNNVPIKKAIIYFSFSGSIGVLIAIFAEYILGNILYFLPGLLRYIVNVGIIEEITKLIPILWLIKKSTRDRISIRFIDIFVLSMICGIGFSATENIIYKLGTDISSIQNTLFSKAVMLSNNNFLRVFSCSFLHCSWSALFGVIAFYGFTIGKTRYYILAGLLISAVLHGFYDHYSDNIWPMMLIVSISFIAVLFIHSFCLYIDRMKSKDIDENTIS
jgi:RsiW-degrading membrane proteinase PrsW (M82 family)